MLPCGLIHCIKHTLGENILLFKLLLLKRYNVGVRHVFSSHLRSELQCWPGNQCGFILVNKAFTESTHTSMGHLSLPVWHKYTVYWSIQMRHKKKGENSVSVFLCWREQHIHQAQLKLPCLHSVIGLEMLGHCCSSKRTPGASCCPASEAFHSLLQF